MAVPNLGLKAQLLETGDRVGTSWVVSLIQGWNPNPLVVCDGVFFTVGLL